MTNLKVFLDLDCTLIRTYNLADVENTDLLSLSKPVYRDLVSIPRPNVELFLEKLSQHNDIFLFTAAALGYAKTALVSHKLHKFFKGMYSAQIEKPNSILNKLGLENWILVDDNSIENNVLKYKLNCLGIVEGRENHPIVVNNKFIRIKAYNPHIELEDNELMKTLKLINEKKEEDNIKMF